MKKRRIVLITFLTLLSLYILSYAWFRQTHIEIWEKDNRAYVIFPEDKIYLYYFYRPLSYSDGRLTGIGFHIGRHR